MSSPTISTTVWGEAYPCSRTVGLNTRTEPRPRRRVRANFRCAIALAASSAGSRAAISCGSTFAKYARRYDAACTPATGLRRTAAAIAASDS